MKRKEYRRKMDYINGYKQGYRRAKAYPVSLCSKTEDFKRGYNAGKKDFADCEPPLY